MTPMQFAVCGFLVAPMCTILGFILGGETDKNIPMICCTGVVTGLIGYVLGVLWNLPSG